MAQTIQLESGESIIFDVCQNNPFIIFPWFQKLALESVGRDNVLDLSRGDPGYGFSPSTRSRFFYSYLVFLDTQINNFKQRLVDKKASDASEIMSFIEKVTKSTYGTRISESLISDWHEYLTRFKKIASEQGLPAEDWDIMMHTFGYSNVSGGNYHNPWGEPHTRAVLAYWHSRVLGHKISYKELLLTSGASHAIGAVYEGLGAEGIGYLVKGSKVVLFSPSYFPYMNLNDSRGLETIMIRIDPFTGEINEKDYYRALKEDISMIVVIDPNNPTGFSMRSSSLDQIADLAEKSNALIVTDEVYQSFLTGKKSLIQHAVARKRTIRIDSLSKIERSTGLRFGDIFITTEGEQFISKFILGKYLNSGDTIRALLHRSKSPGGGQIGAFRHTTVIPGPCQFMGISHILFGGEERIKFISSLVENMKVFHEILGMPYHGNIYYSLFDLRSIPGWNRDNKDPEACFIELARLGVVLIPANLFFFAQDREESCRRYVVRISLANLSTDKCRNAAEIIRSYVCGEQMV